MVIRRSYDSGEVPVADGIFLIAIFTTAIFTINKKYRVTFKQGVKKAGIDMRTGIGGM